MAKKRSNGEGTVYKRKDGRWHVQVIMPNGQRKNAYGSTRAEVERKKVALLKARNDGLPAYDERLTVQQYFRQWLASSAPPTLRTHTYERYEQYVRTHVVPELGRIRLVRLTPAHLQDLYSRKCNELSSTTVHHIHAVVHKALEQAMRWSLVPRNVADLVSPPRVARHDLKTFSREEARRFLEAVRGDRLEALYVLALTTGMRQGEILALRWGDVRVHEGFLQVRGTLHYRNGGGWEITEPKTKSSRRLVQLSVLAVETLRRHKERQTAERLLRGDGWENHDLVFTNESGRPIDGSNLLSRSFRPLLREAGLPDIRFHDLRHSAATLLLEQGVHAKLVSDMLGHSSIAITLDLYSHVTPAMHRQATEAMDSILSG